MPADLSAKALAQLQKLGVEVRLGWRRRRNFLPYRQ
jgi:hypothetical protein